MCRPAGARVGSNSVGWTKSTKGRSWTSPRSCAASDAAISSSVPPRWTVAARAQSGARPRNRPVERPIELERGRRRSDSARARGGTAPGSRSPAIRATWRGPRSSITTRAPAQLVERADRRVGLHLPAERPEVAPRARPRTAASRRGRSASPPRAPPPTGAGRRPRCRRASSARNECAALPAKSARAAVPRSRRASERRGRASACSPNRAMRIGLPREVQRRAPARPRRARPRPGRTAPCRPTPVAPAVAEPARGGLERLLEHGRRAAVERMRERRRRAGPTRGRTRASGSDAEEGRGERERMHGGADVVHEAGQRELGGPEAAAERRLRLARPACETRRARARSRRRGRWGRSLRRWRRRSMT